MDEKGVTRCQLEKYRDNYVTGNENGVSIKRRVRTNANWGRDIAMESIYNGVVNSMKRIAKTAMGKKM